MVRRFSTRPRRTWRRFAAILLIAVGIGWAAGLMLFRSQLGASGDRLPVGRTDAIVVLTGGGGRLTEGFSLLAGNRAEKLLISGVYRGVEVAELLALAERQDTDLDCCVNLGYAATDTAGNAAETAIWMRENGYRSLRLVTAHYHMARAFLEFRLAMPEIDIIAHPVEPPDFADRGADLLLREYNKLLLTGAKYAILAGWRSAGAA